MTTHKTLAEARAAKTPTVNCIAEIEHRTEGRCFVGLNCSFDYFATAVAKSPIPDVVKLYQGHTRLTDEEIEAITREAKSNVRCERCGVKVDADTCYHQEEWTRLGKSKVKVTVSYCDGCARTLKAIGAGEHTAMQERASVVPSYEPETYEDC